MACVRSWMGFILGLSVILQFSQTPPFVAGSPGTMAYMSHPYFGAWTTEEPGILRTYEAGSERTLRLENLVAVV